MSSLLISLSLRPSLSILFFAKPNNTRYQNPRFLLVLQSSMAMTASAIWQPQEDGLREICGLLRQHISPTSNKPQIWQQLQHSQFPDFDNYLVFILARAKDLMMFDENEKLLSRNPPNIHHVNNTSMELRCGVNGTESDIVQACQRAAEDQANYFGNLQKGVLPETLDRLPTGMQATILLELMTIRAFHSQILRHYSLCTTIGFRIRRGNLTDILAILVFVAWKIHWQWLSHIQCLPSALEGPGGVWCDVDVVEFSYFGAPAATPKEQLYTELVDGLRGSDLCIGSGSQVASQETYGTLGAIVKSRTGNHQVGFLTNRHVAVDLDYPNQKMFHPLPPSLGPGVYLGAVERATSFITDDLWYGTFAGTNPETFVRADGAFIPFTDDFDVSNVTTLVKGVGEIGNVKPTELQSPICSLIGKQVVKVGRSSGLTTGTIMAYALEYNDEKGICFFTDFLVVGENQQTFDLEGDSGSLILLTGQNGEKPQPIGIIWGGTANRGRLKLKIGQPPENWTSGVDLGRLLDLLELDLITTSDGLEVALQEQRNALAAAGDSAVGESSPREGIVPKNKKKEMFKPLGLNIQQVPVEGGSVPEMNPCLVPEFRVEDRIEVAVNVEEHQFIPNFMEQSPMNLNESHGNPESRNLSALRNGSDEDLCFSLQLGDRETKRRRPNSACSNEDEEQK